MPNVFQRGFEAFGKPIPLRGNFSTRPQPHMAAAPSVIPAPASAPAPVAPPPPQTFMPPQQQNVPPGRIQVYKKGDPNAPPCPVCRG